MAPVDPTVIEELERIDVTDNSMCPVCFETMATGCINLPCTHTFHESCIVRWLTRHSTCPVCRATVGSEGTEAADPADPAEGDTGRTASFNLIHRIHLHAILSSVNTRRTIHFIFMFMNGMQIDTEWDSSTLAYELLLFAKRFTIEQNVKIVFNMGQTQFAFSASDPFYTLCVSLQELMIPNHCIMRAYINQ